MASSSITTKMFWILPLLIVLSITPLSSSLSPSDKTTKELLYHLCSKPSIYNHFCIGWLTSDPTVYDTDIDGLLALVIQKTELFGYKNLASNKGLERTTTEPDLKHAYGACVISYELAIKALESASDYAKTKSSNLASLAAFKALDNISSCKANLEGKKNVPAYVTTRDLMFERMCNIVDVFALAL